MKDHNDIRMPLELIDANVGKETLGMFLAPDGSRKEQYQAMQDKVTKWTAKIWAGIITPRDAFHSIFTTIMKSLEYPICVATFTRKECNKLVKPIFNVALPKAYICRTIPHAL